ncbi:MAG: S41 family peptidase [Rhodospirillales bacterium]|nr:S41 family peptidase [Rhodospirillales bacterium]
MKKILWLAAAAAFLLTAQPLIAAEKKKPENTFELLQLFGDVFERVRSSYVEEVSDEQLIEAAIAGMLTSLDPHSSYLNAKNYKDMQVQTRGKFGGLGIEVTMENGVIKVVSPIDDTPAQRAGILPGDLITHLDGKQVLGLSLSQAVELMRGKVGSDLKMTLQRKGKEPFDVTITRAIIPIRTVRSHLEGDIAYVRISSFSQPTIGGLERAMRKMTKELGDKFKGVVLDLRNNPGGLLDQAVAVSDAFLDRGEIVSTRPRQKDGHQRFNAKPGDLADGKPIVVLINGGSASASEIVAGALQDLNRAIILGTQSFGKGSVQTILPLGPHGAMRLTTALYFTPSGKSIQKIGIKPDIEVEQIRLEAVVADRARSREADLRGALDQRGKDGKGKPGQKSDNKEPLSESEKTRSDFQLQRALDLLRGVDLFTKRLKG